MYGDDDICLHVALRAVAFLEMLTKLVATRATTARSLLDVFSAGWVGKRYDFVQVGRQHSRYKAVLLSIVLSQQCCKVQFISLTLVKP